MLPFSALHVLSETISELCFELFALIHDTEEELHSVQM